MIRSILKRLRAKREAELTLARRSVRLSNRRADVAAAYTRVHTILARGPK